MNKAITSVLIIVSLFFMATCGSEPDHGSDTGAIGLSLKWDSTSSYSLYAVLSTNNDVCLEYGIEKISAEVYNSSGTKVASASWVCSARSGTISDVPSGTGMRVIIEGSMSGSVLWSGEASNVSVSVGQTKDVPVTMSYTGSDSTVPSISVMNPLPGATAVAINTSISVTFNKQMVWPSGDNAPTFFTVNNGIVDIPGTVTYDPSTYTLTFTPDSDLSYATTYTVSIPLDVKDMGGKQMTDDYIRSFATIPKADFLVAHYPFNGDANDVSLNENNGLVVNDATLVDDRNGNPNGAYRMYRSGGNNYVQVPNNDSLNLQNFTLSIWFNMDAVTDAFSCLIGKDYTSGYAIGIDSGSSGDCPALSGVQRVMRVYVGGNVYYFTLSDFSCNTWYHVAVTYNNSDGTLLLYVDGSIADKGSVPSGSISSNSSPLGIGRDGIWGDQFNGAIDEVLIYNQVLSEAEIQALAFRP